MSLPHRRPDRDRMKAALAQPIVFDGRNLYEPSSRPDTTGSRATV